VNRVFAYIDGYNLYHGLKDKQWKKYLWLDIPALLSSLIKDIGTLQKVFYFSSPSYKQASENRRRIYLKALEVTCRNMGIWFYKKDGRFRPNTIRCYSCNDIAKCDSCKEILEFYHEKETDVNIAVQMLLNANNDDFDTALLVTEDSDQVGTIKAIRKICPE